MKRFIVGLIMLLAIPVLANSVAIANFAVERYADYTWSKPSTTPSVVTDSPSLDEILHESLVGACLNRTGKDKDKVCSSAGANRIYSVDTGVIVRDFVLVLIGVGGVVLIVSAILRGKK